MRARTILAVGMLCAFLAGSAALAQANGDLHKVKHIIVVMQENHSFDNYFGALPYMRGGLYHGGPCQANDHRCVDGLSCTPTAQGLLNCSNSNLDDDGSIVFAFHEPRYCVGPDLDHSWSGSHMEANFNEPSATILASPNDGFVRRNDSSLEGQPDNGGAESADSDDTMGFYTQADLPFYYALAESFAIDDRYFSSVMGQTFANRAYATAATSFGHLSTAEIVPPAGGYKPITGTIYDLLDAHGVSWTDYFSDVPISSIFRPTAFPFIAPPHSEPISMFLVQAAAGTLPQVSFIDPNFGFLSLLGEDDEHPPSDIRKGEAFVAQVVNAVRNGPNWKNSIILITYDEHGGFYDHVAPAPAAQGGQLTPDGINPGQCADLSNPPASEQPGGGAQCAVSRSEALAICPGFSDSGPYPADCANFNQLGFRVPFIAVSPFSKPHYVSHTVGDHTSILALIEKRFLSSDNGNGNSPHPSLTLRDANADPLEDLFNFSNAPSRDASIPSAPAGSPNDPGCPFVPSLTNG